MGRHQETKPHFYFQLLDGFPNRVVADRRAGDKENKEPTTIL